MYFASAEYLVKQPHYTTLLTKFPGYKQVDIKTWQETLLHHWLLRHQRRLPCRTPPLLGTTIANDISWDNNVVSLIIIAQRPLYSLCPLKKLGLGRVILVQFYPTVMENVLTSSINVCYGNTTVFVLKRLSVWTPLWHESELNVPPWLKIACQRVYVRVFVCLGMFKHIHEAEM